MNKLEKLIIKNSCAHVFNEYQDSEETEEIDTLYLSCVECGEKRIEEFDKDNQDTQIDIIKNGNKPSLEYETEYNKKLLKLIK